MEKYQEAYVSMMEAVKVNSEDNTLPVEVRQYAQTVYMTMQAREALIQYQELEEVNTMFPPS